MVRLEPFTVMILRDVGHCVQEVTLGVDVGSRHIGLSATTENKELYSSQVELRTDVSGLLLARREFRKARRGRKHNWYRPARLANRANRRNQNLSPSIRHKADSHIRAIKSACKILPIIKIRVELGRFDIQKIKNPFISGEQYLQGPLAGWENLKAYAKWRDGYKCRSCGKRAKDGARLEVHHIRRRADGGSDTPDNVVTLCHECHENHHKGAKKLKLKRPPTHRNEAHMNAMRKYLREVFILLCGQHGICIAFTYGYETAHARREHCIEKSHSNDAFCIAGNFNARQSGYNVYLHRLVRRHNRRLHKSTILTGGYRKANQAPKYVYGFRLFDNVRYKGIHCFVFSRRTRGEFDIRKLDGRRIADGVSYKRLVILMKSTSILTERNKKMPYKSNGKWKWGNVERESKKELVQLVYGIWVQNGAKGEFADFWETGKTTGTSAKDTAAELQAYLDGKYEAQGGMA